MVRCLVIASPVLFTACLNSKPMAPLIHLRVQDVVVESGSGQTGVEGQPLAKPILAHAILSDGSGDKSHVIYCQITSGGGSIEIGGSTASGDGAILPGPGDGTVSVVWTLGPAGQQQRLHLYVVVSDTVSADVTAVSLPSS